MIKIQIMLIQCWKHIEMLVNYLHYHLRKILQSLNTQWMSSLIATYQNNSYNF